MSMQTLVLKQALFSLIARIAGASLFLAVRPPPCVAAESAANAERPVAVYSLEDCLRIGLRDAAAMRNARRDREIAERVVDQVRAGLLPSLEADGSYTRRDKLDSVPFGDENMEIGSLDNYAISLTARQLLYSGGSLSAAVDAAQDYRIMSDDRLRQTRAALARRIREGFIDLLYLRAALEANIQSVQQWQDALDQTSRRFAQDMASEFDVLQARVQRANAQPGLIQASNRLAIAKAAFADLIRIENDDFILSGELRFEPYTLDTEEQTAMALRSRPEYRIARQGLALREAEIRVENSAYRPTLHLSLQYGAQQSPLSFNDSTDLDWRWSASLQARWNLLDGGLRRHRIREKRLERDKTLEDIAALERRLSLEAHQARLAIEQASQTVEAMRATVALAEKALEIAKVRYSSGLATRLELAEANLALTSARLHWLGALRDHAHAVIAMRFALGRDAADD